MTSAAVPWSAIGDENEHVHANTYLRVKQKNIFFVTTSAIVSWSAAKMLGVPTFENAFSEVMPLLGSGNPEDSLANIVYPMVGLALTGASFGTLSTAINWLHEGFERVAGETWKNIVEWIKEKSGFKSQDKIPINIWNRYTKDIAVLVTGNHAAKAVARTLSAMNADMRAQECGDMNVIICHRYHLRAAVNAVADFAASRNEVSILNLFQDGNVGPIEVAPPSILKTKGNGEVVAIWADIEGKPSISVRYDRDGTVAEAFDLSGQQVCKLDDLPAIPPLDETLDRMESSLNWKIDRIISGSKDMIFDSRTHNVVPAPDGSIVVKNNKTDKVDNPYGPAVITANGDKLYFRNGKIVSGPWKYADRDNHPPTMTNADKVLYIEKSLTT